MKWTKEAVGAPSIEINKPSIAPPSHFAAAIDADKISKRVWDAIDEMTKAVEEVYKIPDAPVGTCQLPGAAGRPPEAWLSDTGARYDMVGKNSFPTNDPSVFKAAQKTDRAINLFTGNGVTTVRTELPLISQALGEEVKPMLMENSPPAIAIGERCWEQGWHYIFMG